MATDVFKVEGVRFVSGLFWQPLAGLSQGDRGREIKSLAKELAFDLRVICLTSAYCVGFAKEGASVRHGDMSAAAVVSKSIYLKAGVRDFIFVSQLPDGQWLYVAQRDALILPDGDQLFSSEEAAKSRLLDDIGLGEWALVVAPDVWHIKNSTEYSFVSVIERARNGKFKLHNWWKLSYVDALTGFTSYKGQLILVIVLVGVAFGGWQYYLKIKHEREMEAAAALAAQQRLDAQGHVVPLVHPWKSIPAASAMLTACMGTISSARLFPGNWAISSINCSNTAFTISWTPKEMGWIEHLKVIQPDAVISMDGSTASMTIPLHELRAGYDEAVHQASQRLVEMYSAAQKYGVKFTATPAPPPIQPLPGQGGQPVPPKDWNEINWKADGVDLPVAVLAALDGDGFRMSAMRAIWQNGKFIWTMEGTQYVKP